MFRIKLPILALMGLLYAGAAVAQTADAVRFYKLDFAVKELEAGKPVNTRTFSAMLSLPEPGKNNPVTSIRTGGRIPMTSSNGTQFLDLGVNLDIRELREVGQGEVSFYVSADISSAAQDNPSATPVIRQNKWTAVVLTAIRKPTVVFSSDDLSSKRQMQLEVTATPMK